VRTALGESRESASTIRTVHGRGYGIGVEVKAEAAEARPASADAGLPSSSESFLIRPAVAVLPFRNESGDPGQDYLALGLTEETVTALASWRWFPVISRKASQRYGDSPLAPAEIARGLGARYLVTGSLRRAGDGIRLGVQLVDGVEGEEIWARRFERPLRDVFALQDELAERIAAEIEPHVGRAEARRVLRRRPQDLDAWDGCIRALWHVQRGAREDFAEARGLLERAVELDPGSSYVWSIRALALFEEALLGWTANPVQAFEGTLRAARQAVELDDQAWLAHALLGIGLLWTHRDYERAMAEEHRALELNPSASIAYQFLGCVLEFAGDPAQAISKLEATLRLDPRYQSTALILSDLALCHLLLGQAEEAAELARRAVAEQPENARAWQRLAAALAEAGRDDEARAACRELRRLQPGLSLAALAPTYPFRRRADLERFLSALGRAGLEPTSSLPS
jgi:TolB-like protein/Flp pilus assembly protein TadD